MRMRALIILVPLMLAACGSTEKKTVIINPPANSTVVVDHDGDAHVVKH